MDWLVEVHLKFKLVPDTLYLTVSIIDKFLEVNVYAHNLYIVNLLSEPSCIILPLPQVERVTRTELQLVGVTALLLASKVGYKFH